MKNVTVKKDDLIAKIKANRAEHREVFEAAQVKYREKVIELLDERLKLAKEGKIQLRFSLPEPVDYTSEYDMALEQLEWEVDEEVTLDQGSFRELVLNQWSWAQHFASNSTAYVTGQI